MSELRRRGDSGDPPWPLDQPGAGVDRPPLRDLYRDDADDIFRESTSDIRHRADRPSSLADLYDQQRVPTRSELVAFAEGQDWTLEQTENGPAVYRDDDGTARLKIKSGSPRAPGSDRPHIEVRDAEGNRVDPFGNPVARRSPDNHYPYRPDPPEEPR